MNIDDVILEKSRMAAYAARNQLGVSLSPQDIEDATQAASLGFIRAWRRKNGNVGYCYVAAKNEAIKFIVRVLFGNNPVDPVEYEKIRHYLSARDAGRRNGLSDEVADRLFQMLLGSRLKKGERGRKAALREVLIADALCQEKNDAAIAMDLDIPERDVKTYRLRLRARLDDIYKAMQ
jgi:hypothetical protein